LKFAGHVKPAVMFNENEIAVVRIPKVYAEHIFWHGSYQAGDTGHRENFGIDAGR
jgi:hypothetical protein